MTPMAWSLSYKHNATWRVGYPGARQVRRRAKLVIIVGRPVSYGRTGATGQSRAMNDSTTTIEFRKLRDTKNTVRFEEQTPPGKPPVIGTIYVQKWFAGDAENFTVTLTKESK